MTRILLAFAAAAVLTTGALAAEPVFPDWRQFRDVANSSYAEPDGDRVLTAVGYGPGIGFDTLYRHFEWGNAYTLDALKTRFDTGPVDWAALAAKRKAAAASAVAQGGKTQ